jgi:hypothetical protein
MIPPKRLLPACRAAAVLVASLVLPPVAAQAQSTRTDAALAADEKPDVEKLIARGIELRNEGRDADALKLFERAATIDPDSIRLQLHLATTHQALGNWLRADDYLTSALQRVDHPYVLRHRPALEEAKRVINDNIGRLEIDGEPAGAEVLLNGRQVGTLPLSQPVRATVGQYLLEVRLDGHYTARRPVTISGHGLVRESVKLEPLPPDERTRLSYPQGPVRTAPSDGVDRPAPRSWLTWTFVGLGSAAAATTVGALVFREVHAGRWNDNTRCLELERTREQVCGSEREKAETAGTIAAVSGIATGLFAAGALANLFVFSAREEPGQAGLDFCSVGFSGASCSGSF